MMMKKTLLFIFIILLVLSIGTVSATNETDTSTPDITNTNSIMGENTENNNIIILSNDNAQKSMTELENTIKNNENTTIFLNDNYQWTEQDTYLENGIIVDKSIIIDGQGHKIDVNHKMRIFKVTNNADVTFKNINFLNGGYDHIGGGGAVWNYEAKNITIINCMFNGNIAAYGGAIYNDVNKPLTIINCSFNNNNACGVHGGAIYSNGNVYIENSLFNSNHADEDGGAIFCCNNAYITDCLFESNKVNGAKVCQCEGGAICCKEDLTVENSTFKNNYADDYGGAIYANTLTLNSNCIFDSNIAYDNQGGAIWVNKFKEDVTSTSFINNKAGEGAKDDGGAIYINKENHITFSNCTFKSNCAGDEGGAIYLDSSSSDLTLKNNIFIDNHADDEGQVVFNKGTYGTIKNNQWETDSPDFSKDLLVEWKRWTSNIRHKDESPLKYFGSIGTFNDLQKEINNASEGSVLYLTRDYNVGYGSRIQINKNLTINGQGHTIDCLNTKCNVFYSNCGNIVLINIMIKKGYNDKGGAIHISSSAKYTIENCTFLNNFATDYGGAIYNEGNNILTIKNCKFSSNRANNHDGGAIFSTKDIIIKDSIFDLNVADENGGAISCGANIYVVNTIFYSNNVKSREWSLYEYIYHWVDNPQCRGGAIFAKGNVDIKNSTFTSNFASDYGGAIYANKIYINNNQESGKDFNSFFINNVAKDNDGGALYSLSEIYMKNTLLFNNSAHEDGGAIFCDADGTHLTHCLFNSNKAEGAKYNDCDGGAVYCKYKPLKRNDLIITNCTFINNFATDYGGAIYAVDVYVNNNQGSGENFKSFFINNTAKNDDGGAICTVSIVCYVVIFNSEFSDNNAGDYGGAIRSTDIDVINSTFTNNNAQGGTFARLVQGGGGALYGGHIEITNSQFKNNHADDSGGAIHSRNTLLLKGENLFLNNKCENHGGAIYTGTINSRHGDHSSDHSIDVENVTFTSNHAGNDGGAIYINHEYDGTFTYCIFEKNTAEKRGGAIFIDSHFSDVKLTKNMFIENYASSGNSGFTCNVGGVFGDAFILGPNYYGESDNSREGQFSYSKVGVEFVPDIMSEHVGMPDSGYDQKVQTWFRNPLDIYTDNAVVENTSTFNVAKGLNQIADIINVPTSPFPFTPGLGDVVIRGPLKIITVIKDLF